MKVMAFLSWIIYIGFAFANNIMIEAFVFSIGLVIISYLIFGRKPPRNQQKSGPIKNSQASKEKSSSHNYLSVFFHGSHQVDQLDTMK